MSTFTRNRDEDKENIERRWDVLELLAELGVALRPGPQNRRNVDITCPFHADGSYHCGVETERGVWNCRSAHCQRRGDFWDLYQHCTGLGFFEAKKTLATRYAVPLRYGREERETLSEAERVRRTRQWYVRWCMDQLEQSPEAQQYLADRGLTPESSRAFKLGYAPAAARLPASSKPTAQITWDDLELAGVMYQDREGKLRRRFINRLMVPITVNGAIVDLSGRTLTEREDVPKYMNLEGGTKYPWGLDHLGDDPDLVLLTEGQFDAMLAYQEGTPALALRGTSNNFLHYLNLLPERCGTVTVLDNDVEGTRHIREIGEHLMLRGLMNYVAILPEGQDPAEFIREYQEFRGFWQQFIEAAEPYPAWRARHLQPERLMNFKYRVKELEPVVQLLLRLNPLNRHECYEELQVILHDYGIGREMLDDWVSDLKRRERGR